MHVASESLKHSHIYICVHLSVFTLYFSNQWVKWFSSKLQSEFPPPAPLSIRSYRPMQSFQRGICLWMHVCTALAGFPLLFWKVSPSCGPDLSAADCTSQVWLSLQVPPPPTPAQGRQGTVSQPQCRALQPVRMRMEVALGLFTGEPGKSCVNRGN
jgi:hypothetical protein